MKILLVSATPFEMAPTLDYLEAMGQKKSFFEFSINGKSIFPLITGIGAMKTAFAMARFAGIQDIDIAINMGVAGSFDPSLALGEVVEVERDRFADLGVEERDGSFTDVYDLGLEKATDFIHAEGWIYNENCPVHTDLQKVSALTVNKVHGSLDSIDKIKTKYSADIESMEGAAFYYACKSMDVKCIQLRGISNYVEPRNRDGWELDKAINAVNKSVVNLLKTIEPPQRRKAGFEW